MASDKWIELDGLTRAQLLARVGELEAQIGEAQRNLDAHESRAATRWDVQLRRNEMLRKNSELVNELAKVRRALNEA